MCSRFSDGTASPRSMFQTFTVYRPNALVRCQSSSHIFAFDPQPGHEAVKFALSSNHADTASDHSSMLDPHAGQLGGSTFPPPKNSTSFLASGISMVQCAGSDGPLNGRSFSKRLPGRYLVSPTTSIGRPRNPAAWSGSSICSRSTAAACGSFE